MLSLSQVVISLSRRGLRVLGQQLHLFVFLKIDQLEEAGLTRHQDFARDLRALVQAPRPGLAREPTGPILHAFFGWGVLLGKPVRLDKVMPAFGGTGGLKLVRADLVVHGARRQILVRPVREDGLWKIVDISYDHGESLVAYYRRITAP